jgi:hypothetical protein
MALNVKNMKYKLKMATSLPCREFELLLLPGFLKVRLQWSLFSMA